MIFEQPLIYTVLGLNLGARLAESKAHMCLPLEAIQEFQLWKLNELFRKLKGSIGARYLPYSIEKMGGDFGSFSEFAGRVPILEKQQVQERLSAATKSQFPVSVMRETAGTSGRVTRVVISRKVLAAQFGARALSMGWHGIRLGEREGRVWGRPVRRGKVTIMERMLNRRVVGALESASERLNAARFLSSFDPVYLYGYSSHLLSIAPEVSEIRSEFPSLKAAFCTAETLLESQRKALEVQLGVPVFREYGCTEVDIIAAECIRQRYHVMIDRCLVEVAGDAGSGEILVTDLDNFEFPLIRYRLGDIVKLDPAGCDCGLNWPVIGEIEGRIANRYVILGSGKRVHAVTFAHMAESMCERGMVVRQFRVAQESSDALSVRLDLVISDQSQVASAFVLDWVSREVQDGLDVSVSVGPIQSLQGTKNHYFQPLSSS